MFSTFLKITISPYMLGILAIRKSPITSWNKTFYPFFNITWDEISLVINKGYPFLSLNVKSILVFLINNLFFSFSKKLGLKGV
jgi:hypothetical protein